VRSYRHQNNNQRRSRGSFHRSRRSLLRSSPTPRNLASATFLLIRVHSTVLTDVCSEQDYTFRKFNVLHSHMCRFPKAIRLLVFGLIFMASLPFLLPKAPGFCFLPQKTHKNSKNLLIRSSPARLIIFSVLRAVKILVMHLLTIRDLAAPEFVRF